MPSRRARRASFLPRPSRTFACTLYSFLSAMIFSPTQTFSDPGVTWEPRSLMVFISHQVFALRLNEERGNRSLLVDRLDRFRQKWRDTKYFYFIQLARMIAERNRISYDYFFNVRLAQHFDCPAGKHRMREARMYSFSARLFQGLRNFRQRPAAVAHIVDDQTTAATNVTNHVHNLGHVRLLATVVSKSQLG